MTKEEAIKALEAFPESQNGNDTEDDHWSADDILLRRLEALGEQEVSDAFRAARQRVGFYYS